MQTCVLCNCSSHIQSTIKLSPLGMLKLVRLSIIYFLQYPANFIKTAYSTKVIKTLALLKNWTFTRMAGWWLLVFVSYIGIRMLVLSLNLMTFFLITFLVALHKQWAKFRFVFFWSQFSRAEINVVFFKIFLVDIPSRFKKKFFLNNTPISALGVIMQQVFVIALFFYC